jgi:hypothetical protein
MTIKSKRKSRKIEVDLTGPRGNAYFLLGLGKDLASKLGKDWKAIEKEMTSDDYENLLKVFDREFGAYVTLYR